MLHPQNPATVAGPREAIDEKPINELETSRGLVSIERQLLGVPRQQPSRRGRCDLLQIGFRSPEAAPAKPNASQLRRSLLSSLDYRPLCLRALTPP
jgi:hypothetical protein